MSTKTYNTLEGELSVRPAPTVSRSGQSNAVVLIGGYDKATASDDVTAGEPTKISDPTQADVEFGDSELARAAAVVAANGANDIYGVAVPETTNTESFTATQSMSLSESPVFDPTVHPEHEIVVTDTSAGEDLTTNILYDEIVETPSEENTANVNPLTGDIEVDASSDYDVSYTYGDYTDAINTAADLPVRYICPLTESPSIKASVTTVLSDIANDFDFKRAVTGAKPNIQSTDISSYTPDEENWRMVEVAPSRAEGAAGPVRTQAAICGMMASQPLGPEGSTLYDELQGIVDLKTQYRGTEAKGFDGVTSVTRSGTVAQAVTTSTAEQFSNVYATEIIDEVALRLFSVAREYAGGPQDIGDLEVLLRGVCQTASRGSPPLLGFGQASDENPYDISVSLGADTGVANSNVTIVPTPIAEEVNIGLTVTDGFVSFAGAE